MHYNFRVGVFCVMVCGAIYCASTTDIFSRIQTFFHFHRVVVSGNSVLSESDVLKYLPMKRDNLWWYQNRVPISLGLKKHPLIKSALIEPCPPVQLNLKKLTSIIETWGCFKVEINERTPRFRVQLGLSQWLVDEEGVSLVMIPSAQEAVGAQVGIQPAGSISSDSIDARFKKLPLLEGAISDLMSPDEANARIRYLIDKVRHLCSITGMNVTSIKFLDRGEMLVRFESVPFAVRFGSELHTVPGDFTRVALDEQVERLKTLAPRVLGDKEVEEIDLGFNKLAVIRRPWGYIQ